MFLLEDGIPEPEELRSIFDIADNGSLPHSDEVKQSSPRFVRLWNELVSRNPKPGAFLTQVGDTLVEDIEGDAYNVEITDYH